MTRPAPTQVQWESIFRRFFHCLAFFHQSITVSIDSHVVWLGCSCGRTFYGSKPSWCDQVIEGIAGRSGQR